MSKEQPRFELDRGIAVRQRAPGECAVPLDTGWAVGGGVNGGYVLAVVGSALREQLASAGHPDPLTVSAHYVPPSMPGPGTVRVTVRSTRSRSSWLSTRCRRRRWISGAWAGRPPWS